MWSPNSYYRLIGFLWVGKGTIWPHECVSCNTNIHEAKIARLQGLVCRIPSIFWESTSFLQQFWESSKSSSTDCKTGETCHEEQDEKCQLRRIQVCYSSRIVVADGYRLDPNNIQVVRKKTDLVRKRLKTLWNVRQVLQKKGILKRYLSIKVTHQ